VLVVVAVDEGVQKHTPWLDIHSDDRLGSRLYFTSLLLVIFVQTVLSQFGSVCRFLLIVVAAEKIDLIIILLGLLLWCLWVDWELADLWAVGGEVFRWVTWEGGEFRLEGGNVLVPAVCEWVLLDSGLALDGLEGFDIGLRRCVSGGLLDCEATE
jgi:hypothetical protein